MSRWRTSTAASIGLALLTGAVASAEEVVIRGAGGDDTILYRESHALVIGAVDYEHPSWNDLPRVRDEVDEVASALRAHGFETETVMDPSGDELREAIRRFVVEHGFTRANADNRLLIFFSGHGHTRPVDRGYLVPVDAPDPVLDEAGFLDKALDMIEVMSWARRIEAKHALFVFDSCFSGTLFETKARPRPGEAYIRASTAEPVRQFITAGDAGQEVPAASIFTPLFLEALEGEADTNDDDYVTGVELGLFLMQTVPDYNPAQTPQYGKIRDVRLDDGDFVFRVPPPDVVPDEIVTKGTETTAAATRTRRPDAAKLEVASAYLGIVFLVDNSQEHVSQTTKALRSMDILFATLLRAETVHGYGAAVLDRSSSAGAIKAYSARTFEGDDRGFGQRVTTVDANRLAGDKALPGYWQTSDGDGSLLYAVQKLLTEQDLINLATGVGIAQPHYPHAFIFMVYEDDPCAGASQGSGCGSDVVSEVVTTLQESFHKKVMVVVLNGARKRTIYNDIADALGDDGLVVDIGSVGPSDAQLAEVGQWIAARLAESAPDAVSGLSAQ